MHARFEARIELGLQKIAASCENRRQKPLAVATRVGRLLGENTRAAGLFEVRVEEAADGRARLRWSKLQAWASGRA